MTAYLGLGFGGWEIWIILAVVLLLFAHRIPTMARSMGSGIVEFKKGLKEGEGGAEELPGSGEGPKVTVESKYTAEATDSSKSSS